LKRRIATSKGSFSLTRIPGMNFFLVGAESRAFYRFFAACQRCSAYFGEIARECRVPGGPAKHPG
jgi:hypothetical protein